MKNSLIFLTIFSLFFAANEAFAKRKKPHPVKVYPTISAEYLISVNLTQSECETLIGGECFRRDHMRDEPYYHISKVIIFHDKIFAEQFFENREKLTNMLMLKVKDGSYKLTSENGNLISFATKNGLVSDLKLLEGDLEKEKTSDSKCDLAQTTYGFYQAYDKSQILEKSAFFRDEYNFDGLKEFLFFVEKSKQDQVLVLLRNSVRNLDSIRDIRICKIPNEENFFLKHVSDEECKASPDDSIAAECAKYSLCEDYLVVKNCDVVLLKDAMN